MVLSLPYWARGLILTMTAWSKLLRRDFLIGLDEPFRTGIHEDIPVTCAALLAVSLAGDGRPGLFRHRGVDYKAVVRAAQAQPAINAAWDGDAIVKFKSVGLSVAIAIDDGLVTPVIKEAESKSLLAISRAVKDFAVRAKDKKLKPDEFDGGTITVSNLGAWGIESFDAIVNPPQAAILSVGAAIEKPVVKNGQIVPGLRMNLGLSCDHRVIDGAVGAQFLSEIKKLLEQPALMLL